MLCTAVETVASERLLTNSITDQSVASSSGELEGKRRGYEEDKTMFSLKLDSRYRVAFKRVNNASQAGVSAKELRGDEGVVVEQAEGLQGPVIQVWLNYLYQ